MTTYTKTVLSGSTNGRGIKVTQTATAGDTVHAADSSAIDEIWLWARNDHTSTVTLTLEVGGVTDPDDLLVYNLEAINDTYLVCPGLILTNSLELAAFCATQANAVVLFGYVNRIS